MTKRERQAIAYLISVVENAIVPSDEDIENIKIANSLLKK